MADSRTAYALLDRDSAAVTASLTEEFDTPTDEMAVDVSVTAVAGLSPSVIFSIERQGTDGVWYPVHTFAALTAAGTRSTSIGPGLSVPALLTNRARLSAAITGTTPSITFSASVVGR